jgi:hypothetical protein
MAAGPATWTCRHPDWRQAPQHRPWRWPPLPRGHAATLIGGRACHVDMPPPPMAAGPCHVDMPPPPLAAGPTAAGSILQRQHAGIGNGGRPLPALAQAARATGCRHSRGPFWQIFSEVVSFDISLVQVVSSVKNSADHLVVQIHLAKWSQSLAHRKRSILNLKFIEVWRNKPQTLNPCCLYPELYDPGINRILDLFGSPGKAPSRKYELLARTPLNSISNQGSNSRASAQAI